MVAVTSATFRVPLMAPIATDDDGAGPADNLMPPTRAQFATLSKKLDAVALETKNGLRYLLWAVIVIGCLLLLLKH